MNNRKGNEFDNLVFAKLVWLSRQSSFRKSEFMDLERGDTTEQTLFPESEIRASQSNNYLKRNIRLDF